jgi:hypothetical protein
VDRRDEKSPEGFFGDAIPEGEDGSVLHICEIEEVLREETAVEVTALCLFRQGEHCRQRRMLLFAYEGEIPAVFLRTTPADRVRLRRHCCHGK